MNQALVYACAFLLILCLVASFLGFRFYKQSVQKDERITLLEQEMEKKGREIEKYQQSIKIERTVLLKAEEQKLDITEKFHDLLTQYETLQNVQPSTIIKYKEKIVQPSCSIPDVNFRLLKQAYCQNRSEGDYCTSTAP